ncbi:MAG: hypothetical protein NT092_07130, partial [Bacteroidia bacterium]|nr:hypothetical protein [Bacteroidia bacterium]
FIKAESLERAVWSDVLVMLALNPKRAYQKAFDPKRNELEIDRTLQTIMRLESELTLKNKARKRLYELESVDDDKFNADDTNQLLHRNKEQILTLQGHLSEAQDRLRELRSEQDDERKALEFFTNNRKQFAQLRQGIRNLSLKDRKTLIEAMLNEPIRIDFQDSDEQHPEDGPAHVQADYHLHLNPDVLQRFMDEGKLGKIAPKEFLQ